jgi:hypothetical protein
MIGLLVGSERHLVVAKSPMHPPYKFKYTIVGGGISINASPTISSATTSSIATTLLPVHTHAPPPAASVGR